MAIISCHITILKYLKTKNAFCVSITHHLKELSVLLVKVIKSGMQRLMKLRET